MSLGVLPQIIATVSTVGPTIYGLVDSYQQRKRENAAALAQAHGGVPSGPSRPEWVVPVVSAVVVSGATAGLLWWWYKKQKSKKKGRKKREVDDDLDE